PSSLHCDGAGGRGGGGGGKDEGGGRALCAHRHHGRRHSRDCRKGGGPSDGAEARVRKLGSPGYGRDEPRPGFKSSDHKGILILRTSEWKASLTYRGRNGHVDHLLDLRGRLSNQCNLGVPACLPDQSLKQSYAVS